VDETALTTLVVTENVAEDCPVAMLTLLGTVARLVLAEERSTTVVVVAGAARVT